MNSTKLFNLTIYNQSKEDLLLELQDIIEGKLVSGGKQIKKQSTDHFKVKTTILFTPNAEQVVQAEHSDTFKKTLLQADILIPDGMSIVWACRLKNKGDDDSHPPVERIAGVDVVSDILQKAKEKTWKIAVVGGVGYEGVFDVESEINDGSQKHIMIKNISWTPGYKDIKNPTLDEEQKTRDFITKHSPDIVLVAFGAPFQEKWIVEHRDLLSDSGVKLAMAVGGSFDFITGQVSRAPQWMQDSGLEWLYRLVRQPWRWRRQMRLFEFWWRVVLN